MLLYFTAIWSILYILWRLGIFYGNLVYFPRFWYIVPRKIWQPWLSKKPDEIRNFVEHLARRVLLPDFAVDPADQFHVVRICGY
jgi:hypothetical protein